MNVASILKRKGRDVATASPNDLLSDIVKVLSERRIGAIVICDRPGRVSGIISERDIVRALAQTGAAALDAPVSRFMTSTVRTCGEADTVDGCMSVMTEGRFRHLPVVTDGELVGIVSIGDIVKERIAEAEHEAEAMRSYIAAG